MNLTDEETPKRRRLSARRPALMDAGNNDSERTSRGTTVHQEVIVFDNQRYMQVDSDNNSPDSNVAPSDPRTSVATTNHVSLVSYPAISSLIPASLFSPDFLDAFNGPDSSFDSILPATGEDAL